MADKNYLCFTAESANSTIQMAKNGSPTRTITLQASTDDGVSWQEFVIGATVITLNNVGDKVYFKGDNPSGFSESSKIYYNFVMSGTISSSGNVMSLVDSNCELLTIPSTYCFYYLFKQCVSLTSPPELPATTLTGNCYGYMFSGCKLLKFSEISTAEYLLPYRIPSIGIATAPDTSLNSMFANTGGTFTGTPNINTSYYICPSIGYSIIYHTNDGVPIPSDLARQTVLPNPLPFVSKPNYIFSGWYTDSTFMTLAVAGAEISADTDLYAKFEPLITNDLTGWTWIGNITLDIDVTKYGITTFPVYINFICEDTKYNDLNWFLVMSYHTTGYGAVTVYDPNGGWVDSKYRTIQITGGTNVTDINLISWLQANGTLTRTPITLYLSTIGLPEGSHSIQMKLSDNGVTKEDSILSNVVSYTVLPQLSTPTNITADGTTIEFDAVENAENYEVLADGVSIGEYTPVPQGGTLTINFIDDGNINGQVIINDGSPQTIRGTQTKVYENVYSFEVQSFLACEITNQTGSMVGVTEHWTRYEINGDGSATIEFYD